MRAFDGQRSDNRPIKRSKDEQRTLLKELKATLAGMKSHTAPALRESITRRIKELETALAGA